MSNVHSFFTKPVKYIMQGKGKVLESGDTVFEAVGLMNENGMGFVIVMMEDGKAGIVTLSDLVFRVIGELMDPKKTPLKEVATRNPATVNQNSSLELAFKLMRDKNLMQLIVVDDNGKPVGRLEQKFFFKSFVNIALGDDDSAEQSWVNRYIHDIVDHNVNHR